MKKILVWETLPTIHGGQKMTLTITNMLKHQNPEYEFIYLVPGTGPLTAALDRHKISYHLMGDQTLPSGIKSKTVIPRYLWLTLNAVVKFIRIAAREKPDLIYVAGPAALPWGAIGGRLIRRPVIWHLHHIFIDPTTKKLLNLCSGCKSVKVIVSVSDCVADQIINQKATAKKQTLYNPVDAVKYSSGWGVPILEELGIEKKRKTVILGHIALLQPLKRQDMVLSIIEEIRRKGYDAHVLFVGSARGEDESYERSLRDDAIGKGISDFCHFMGQRSDVPNILQAVDTVVIPSLEGLPLVALEAMASGKPIAAVAKGGNAELIKASGAGYCFQDSNIEMAAEMILKSLESKERERLIRNGREFVQTCSEMAYSYKMTAVFNEVSE